MATTEAGHDANRFYIDADGNAHLNGSTLYLDESGNGLTATGHAIGDDDTLTFGGVVDLLWETADANANKLLVELPAGGSVDVPVIVIGQAIESVDMAIHDGLVNPTVCMLGTGAVATGPVVEFRKSRGTATAPTVVTTGDDTGSINSYACVAAGEWVQNAQILFECTGTVATTRGPGVITFKTATDAAPSVLTTALTISPAQLVTAAAGLTVTTGAVTVSSGDVTITSGDLNFTAASEIHIPANTAAALDLDDGTTSLLVFDTRNTVTVQNIIMQGPASQTLPDGATSRARILSLPSKTFTLAGTTQVTTANLGMQLFIDAPTIAQSGGAVTVDRASTLHVGTLVAGSMVTVTANHMISTDVSGAFLTAAGVWTDMACWESGKNDVQPAKQSMIERIISGITPKSWTYKTEVHGDDQGRERVGIAYDDLPEALLAPGPEKAVSAGILSSFALAAIKLLWDRNQDLEARLAKAGL